MINEEGEEGTKISLSGSCTWAGAPVIRLNLRLVQPVKEKIDIAGLLGRATSPEVGLDLIQWLFQQHLERTSERKLVQRDILREPLHEVFFKKGELEGQLVG